MKCRFCETLTEHSFCDLGSTPLSNAYLKEDHLSQKEPRYPLHAYVCPSCFLVQLEEFEKPAQIFSEYAYFSSYSETWLRHAENYTNQIIKRFDLTTDQSIIEIASNDGYLLQFFQKKNFRVLGIEPAKNVAETAHSKGIHTLVDFFSTGLAQKLRNKGVSADLLIANNVLAHVPNLNDFINGMKILLNSKGVISIEFPHLLNLMNKTQFDTIYHEHFSYFSLITVDEIFSHHGLTIFDVEEISTHGGSLRIYARHQKDSCKEITERLVSLKEKEIKSNLKKIETYSTFNKSVKSLRQQVLNFLHNVSSQGKTVVGYGAPAKGNTLLNFCGIDTTLIPYTVDLSPHKQGYFLPGSRIPIFSPEKIKQTKPDYLLILPWNIQDEIINQMSFIREWGGRFVIPIPKLEVLP